MRRSIKEVLMERDNMSEKDADSLIEDARKDMYNRLDQGEIPDNLCEEWFGLEPDYLDEFV